MTQDRSGVCVEEGLGESVVDLRERLRLVVRQDLPSYRLCLLHNTVYSKHLRFPHLLELLHRVIGGARFLIILPKDIGELTTFEMLESRTAIVLIKQVLRVFKMEIAE